MGPLRKQVTACPPLKKGNMEKEKCAMSVSRLVDASLFAAGWIMAKDENALPLLHLAKALKGLEVECDYLDPIIAKFETRQI